MVIDALRRGMLHDPETYANPSEFIPERYQGSALQSAEPDPHTVAFGFGRRWASLLETVKIAN